MNRELFIQLRAGAREKRDKLIDEARAAYEATLVDIARLEQDMLGKVPTRHKSISASIDSVIPRMDTFTTADIMASLEALDGGRVWRKRSIDSHISRLRERGLVKRIKRATIREPAVYVRSEITVKVAPLDDMTLVQVIRQVLTRPMSTTEVVVAVVEAGYQSTMRKGNLRNHVARTLAKGGFGRDGAKWVAGDY